MKFKVFIMNINYYDSIGTKSYLREKT